MKDAIVLNERDRADAVASLKRYAEENLAESLGDMPANMLLNFVLQEIGPAIYNRAVQDAQVRMQSRVADLSGELFVTEFPYWPREGAKRKRR